MISGLRQELDRIFKYGNQISFTHLTGSVADSDFDDAQTLVVSGDVIWTSGLISPIKNKWGSEEAVLLQQGKITMQDKVIYVDGNIETTDTMKIGVGSPASAYFSVIPEGVSAPGLENNGLLYKKIYVRKLPNANFINEANWINLDGSGGTPDDVLILE